MSYFTGLDRSQSQFLPRTVDEYVAVDSPVRFIEAFVEGLDLIKIGLACTHSTYRGRPGYHPKTMLKLLLYGYLNRYRSTRRLEAECHRNLEVIWLLQGLRPDHKTISEFRRKNIQAFPALFKEFNLLCRKLDLFAAQLVAIDGFKVQANNAFHKSYDEKQMLELLEKLDRGITEYLSKLAEADAEEEGMAGKVESDGTLKEKAETKQLFENKLAALQQERAECRPLLDKLYGSNRKDVSRTDPDSRRLKGKGKATQVGYNTQVAADSKHGLIVAAEVVADANDFNQLAPMTDAVVAFFEESQHLAPATEGAPEASVGDEDVSATAPSADEPAAESKESAKLQIVADSGYSEATSLEACAELGVETFVPRRHMSRGKGKGGVEIYSKDEFVYDAEKDVYICPNKQEMTKFRERTEANGRYDYYRTNACLNDRCKLKDLCTTGKQREISRRVNEEYVDQARQRVKDHPEMMAKRQGLVEKVFGAFRTWGYDKFLLRGFDNVRGEYCLASLAYNLRRCINILGVEALIQAVTVK